jgi:hypothetical protein
MVVPSNVCLGVLSWRWRDRANVAQGFATSAPPGQAGQRSVGPMSEPKCA